MEKFILRDQAFALDEAEAFRHLHVDPEGDDGPTVREMLRTAAAAANDGIVIGVDVDQSSESETVVTSAMKGLSDAAEWAIAKVYDGTWDEIGNAATSLGVAENAVGLPTATWSMENFSVADYEDLFQKVLNGDITIDNNSEMANPAEGGLTNVNVNYIGG